MGVRGGDGKGNIYHWEQRHDKHRIVCPNPCTLVILKYRASLSPVCQGNLGYVTHLSDWLFERPSEAIECKKEEVVFMT